MLGSLSIGPVSTKELSLALMDEVGIWIGFARLHERER